MKAIVCAMTSSGIRLGAWDFLLWEHITPITREGKLIAARIIVFAGDQIAGMKSINTDILMGHSIGISDAITECYYRMPEGEILEDYLKAMDFLTISENNILRERLSELSEKTSRVIEEKLHNRDVELQAQDKLKADAIANLADHILKLQEEIEILKNRDILETNG